MWGKKIKAFACKEPTDMRCSYDSLYNRTKELLGKDPYSGHIFVFVNKPQDELQMPVLRRHGIRHSGEEAGQGAIHEIQPPVP